MVMLLQVKSPMDLATLLSRVDARQIPTVKAFLDTAALIPAGEQQFWGGDPEGIREVSASFSLTVEEQSLWYAVTKVAKPQSTR